jgi:Yeast mitochondrial distribution and morphology (MDM) proteins
MRVLSQWISANRTLIPVRCRVVKGMEHFDGAWTVRFYYVSFGRKLMVRLL